MNKRLFISWLSAGVLLMFPACHPYLGYEDAHYDLSIPQPVHVFVGNPSAGVDVKSGMGTVDRLAQLDEQTIRVFAVNTREGVRYDKMGGSLLAPDFLLNGAAGTLSGSQVYWVSASQYYYPNNSDYYHTYDFTACFLDDLLPLSVLRTEDEVRYELRIDGWQDLMTSRAVPPDGYSFSYLAARTDVNPIFKMQHQMVKLRFELKPGVTAALSKRLNISGFALNAPNQGYLTVASRNGELSVDFSQGEAQSFRLITGKENGIFTYFDNVDIYTITDPSQMTPDKIVPMGGTGAYLLLAPAQKYNYQFDIEDLTTEGSSKDRVTGNLTIPSGAGFLRGNAYVVTFEVFGRNQINIGIETEDWDRYGSSLHFDNDRL